MKKQKILISLIIFACILMAATIVNAADTFTTTDGILVTKKVEGYNGDIDLKISNIELSSEKNYVWGISETSVADNVQKWFVLGNFSVNNKTAEINLVMSNEDILSVLRKTNTVYLFIKDTKDENYLVDKLEMDLTLPPYHAVGITEWLGSYYIIGGDLTSVDQWDGASYNISNAYYKFEKVTDSQLIRKYNDAVENKTSMEDIFDITIEDIENVTDWEKCTRDYGYAYTKIDKENLPKDNELYILYIKAKDSDSKILYGYKIWPIDGKKVNESYTDNNDGNKDNKDSNIASNTQKQETATPVTEKKDQTIAAQKDQTTATYKTLPNTGIGMALIGSVILVIVGGIALLAKYHKYRDIK